MQLNEPLKLNNGTTQVKVFKQDEKGKVIQLHEGIVLQQTTHFARVFNPMSIEKGGDISPELAQLYPIRGPLCWMEVIGEATRPWPIPPIFR